MTRNALYVRGFDVVEFLRSVLAGDRARIGLGLPEVIIAVTVFGVGVLGVAAMGGAARRLAEIAAVRSAQTVAAGTVLDMVLADSSGLEPRTLEVGSRNLTVTIDTTWVEPGLIEIRVTVDGSGPAGRRLWVARRLSESP
jgi:hypothetical protein